MYLLLCLPVSVFVYVFVSAVLGGLIKLAWSKGVSDVGNNDSESVLPSFHVITIVHTKQMHELIFFLFLVIVMQFAFGQMIKEINSIIICQRNRTGYRL